ncbi:MULTISPECIES: DUF2075 domain-containing protein [Arsenicicoccus]|uniref:DUF2075 domain-containing protein n=1 Tax=Arsenicicoccus TaxID=267408 RepID=UPI00257A1DAA|nr:MULTISPECIES: DUF2075 domain-containing protein [Arsenicicoccus]
MAGKAFVRRIPFHESALTDLVEELQRAGTDEERRLARHLLDFPTVYVVHKGDGAGRYEVYVGETSDIRSRTVQHLRADILVREDWADLAKATDAEMYVIGHQHFSKSMTLDVENRLMHWLNGSDAVVRLHNRKHNPQNDYYSRDLLDAAFRDTWNQLRRHDDFLFPTEKIVRESALFKASPFHKLTPQQLAAKARIHDAIVEARASEAVGQLILVEGSAGTGKTVLLSSLFYDLFMEDVARDVMAGLENLDAWLLVNHDQQLTVYEQIALKLGLSRRAGDRVSKPTRFINSRDEDAKPVDVVLVDEAHLLWTQGKQSYRGANQLVDLRSRARVVVAIFDPQQMVATNQYWEPDQLRQLRDSASQVIELDEQMRMTSSEATYRWVRDLVDLRQVSDIPQDPNYDVKVFDDPHELYAAIRKKAEDDGHGLSRLTATFDWEFVEKRRVDGRTWDVVIDTFRVPWNLQLDYSAAERRDLRGRSWAERPRSIDEIGSTFTVQGFDLDYAGVIIGPSVTYRDGRIVFDPSASANRSATQRRTLADGSKATVAEDLLRNELNVLLTRGVRGLYLYAVDPELREALLAAQRH